MDKSVLISIRPKWCEKIASGEKTIEVRKTRPKMNTPFKCYIYCTLPKYPHEDFIVTDYPRPQFYGGGKVIWCMGGGRILAGMSGAALRVASSLPLRAVGISLLKNTARIAARRWTEAKNNGKVFQNCRD